MHIEQVHILPPPVAFPLIDKAPPSQIKGLKARYLPIGVNDENLGTIDPDGTDSEAESGNVGIISAPTGQSSRSKKSKKRKLDDAQETEISIAPSKKAKMNTSQSTSKAKKVQIESKPTNIQPSQSVAGSSQPKATPILPPVVPKMTPVFPPSRNKTIAPLTAADPTSSTIVRAPTSALKNSTSKPIPSNVVDETSSKAKNNVKKRKQDRDQDIPCQTENSANASVNNTKKTKKAKDKKIIAAPETPATKTATKEQGEQAFSSMKKETPVPIPFLGKKGLKDPRR